MPWVRFDDSYPNHPKIGPLSDRLYRIHNEAVFWCARHVTDGVIRADQLTLVHARARKTDAEQLVQRRLWHRVSDPPCESDRCPPAGPDGWVIHDYWGYQPSRVEVDQERRARAERQRKWREKRRGSNASTREPVGAPVDALVTPHETEDKRVSNTAPPRPAPPMAGRGAPRSDPDGSERPPPAAKGGGGPAGGADDEPRPAPADPDTVRQRAAEARSAIRGRVPTPTPAGAFERLMNLPTREEPS